MSDFEIKPETGSIFNVSANKKSDRHPDYNGQCLIGGTAYWVSGWINEVLQGERKGEKYMALKFSPKEQSGSSHRSGGNQEDIGF